MRSLRLMAENALVNARLRDRWLLDPSVAFCNHGSFGACPISVLEAQRRLRDEMERNPVAFMRDRATPLLDAARAKLSEFVGADPQGTVFVRNATTGIATALGSWDLREGDEILLTDHGYEAVRLIAERVAASTGARVRIAEIPVPVEGPADVADAVLGAVSDRTRVAVVDHVTSPTAIVFPIERVVAELATRGVDTIVDGAHGPGQVVVDVASIGAAAYTGNAHKWMCAPKGSGFLSLRPDLRDRVRPLVTSHGEQHRRPGRSHLHDRFDWLGTDDLTAYLVIPEALSILEEMVDGGWDEIRRRNHQLAIEGRAMLDGIGAIPVAPTQMVGSMAALLLGEVTGPEEAERAAESLGRELSETHGVEVAVTWRHGSPEVYVRLSAHLHTGRADFERLVDAVQRTGTMR